MADDDSGEIEYVLFQGPLNGVEVNLQKNARLAEAGLLPAKELVTDALLRRAERIRLEPKGNRSIVTLYVDGIPYPGGRMPRPQGLAITQMIKLLAGLDVRERAQKQSGGLKAELEEKPYELRVEAAPVGEGAERLTITVRNPKEELESPEDLGFTEPMRALIRKKSKERTGLMLVCGPPFAGVTTTAYGIVRTIDAYIYTIYSLADTAGRELNNVPQFEPNPGDDLQTTLTRLERMDVDVVLLDPLRDLETVKTLFANHERMCYVTEFAAKDGAHGIAQLIKWMGSPQPVAEAVRLIVHPKLIRTLCADCKEAYRPNPKLVGKVGLPPETRVLYRPPRPDPDDPDYEPCETCGETGYIGRAGMYEVIEMTPEMKELVATNPAPPAIKQLARKLGMQTLQQEGLRLVAEGKTSLEELQRAFRPAQA
ncbi:MAG TPA: ATPase, T2SS/T4P/T4SS family [Planctomycetaceae bacterium]|nr:ATPase, T2SS/T4P/T4SS family [Planctomycetaceae bacterium]